ncbi:monoamine oxidase [Acinetobacter calcoaceticus]|uniref:Tryptophan 2-monooxygenase n=1 Tax=Acinetobacter calcoaceticus TaxID=471 RepID=A0A4V2R1H9_ACICA|nr:monoamine oxidase [Acinetobacter calcoaceticus]
MHLDSVSPSSDPIVVIGAGIAGLSCAKRLQAAGHQVLLLEAQQRIGGRIHSDQRAEHCFDLGASWIHGIEGNPIWALTQHHHISTVVYNLERSTFYHANGQVFSEAEQQLFEDYIEKIQQRLPTTHADSAFEAVQQILQTLTYPTEEQLAENASTEESPAKESATEIWTEAQLKPMLMAFFQRLAQDPFATTLQQLSADYAQYEGYFAGDEVIFPQGYDQIIQVVAEGLDIIKGVEIEQIHLALDHIQLIDQNQKSYRAAQVVVSVPLGVLKQNRIRFEPTLPAAHTDAIANIGFGSFNKVFLEFEQPLAFRQNAVAGSECDFYLYQGQWYNLLDVSNIYQKPVYLMLFGGEQSTFVDQASDAEVWEWIHASLVANFASIPDQPTQICITRWGKDAYSFGSFSFPLPQHNEHRVTTLNQPIDNRLYFAGEHCSRLYAGTVHGAFLSGLDTAMHIIQA